MKIKCACSGNAYLVTGDKIYPHRKDLYKLNFYLCGCGNYVGCHKGTKMPLGIPANAETRKLRHRCHKMVDVCWDNNKDRAGLYQYLAKVIGVNEFHVGDCNAKQCKEIIEHFEKEY